MGACAWHVTNGLRDWLGVRASAALVTFDPRVARDVRLGRARAQVIWEAFNLFNRDNISAVRDVQYGLAGTTLVPTGDFRAAEGERRRANHAGRHAGGRSRQHP